MNSLSNIVASSIIHRATRANSKVLQPPRNLPSLQFPCSFLFVTYITLLWSCIFEFFPIHELIILYDCLLDSHFFLHSKMLSFDFPVFASTTAWKIFLHHISRASFNGQKPLSKQVLYAHWSRLLKVQLYQYCLTGSDQYFRRPTSCFPWKL